MCDIIYGEVFLSIYTFVGNGIALIEGACVVFLGTGFLGEGDVFDVGVQAYVQY